MRKIVLMITLLVCTALLAQTRDKTLNIEVTTSTNDNLEGQVVTLQQTDYQVSYGSLVLDAEGCLTVRVYAGHHSLRVNREGYEEKTVQFDVQIDTTVVVQLAEKTQAPYALSAVHNHNAYTGDDSVTLTWNTEAPAFFDDFESYEPFSIQFGEWTGIDADREIAAAIVGDYPNRGTLQYAQVINPLTVEPTWWYDYPILQPYSGKQYIGFTRTQSGNANDDWLISPAITPGTDNWLCFQAKAADRYDERFQVYVTTKVDNPVQSDFVRLDKGNYETADLTGWKAYNYSLADYAGQPVKIAIRYISHYSLYGSFMLMLDDFYVGQFSGYGEKLVHARRLPRRSPANPNESFQLFLDGTQVGTTENYSFVFEHLSAGHHTLGVRAVYLAAQSEIVTTTCEISAAGYARVKFAVVAQSKCNPDGTKIELINTSTSEAYQLTVADGKAEIFSLPIGSYALHITEGAFNEYQQTLQVTGDVTFDITLTDRIMEPYNITADVTKNEDGTANALLRWNQELAFTESFEEYDDFATGSFGDWKTIDNDQMPVYPISLNGAIISFPGSGTQYNPLPLAPMVFNPWHTTPAMLPTDVAVKAPTGDKSIIFFSPQRAVADKWLISPEFTIREDFVFNVTVKGYSASYPESMEFCVSTNGDQPANFIPVALASPLSSEEWTIYQTDLSDYAGQTIRLAIHYTSQDAFFAQIDDFTVGPENGEGETIDYGNVVKYEIYLDGVLFGESETTYFQLSGISNGTHIVGIRAIYQNGASQTVDYTLTIATGVKEVQSSKSKVQHSYTVSGLPMTTFKGKGINIVNTPTRSYKILK